MDYGLMVLTDHIFAELNINYYQYCLILNLISDELFNIYSTKTNG
jgi:hypothetical protein